MTMNMRAFTFLLTMLLVTLLATASVAETQQVDVIEVQNRPAETLIEVIRPLLPAGAAISASGNQLVVRSTPEEIAKLNLLIEELDRPLAQFLLSVRFAPDTGTRLDEQAAVRRYSTRRGAGYYQVRALEGYPSHIETTTELTDRVDLQAIYPGYLLLDREKRQLVGNFYATPRALGQDRITLAISTRTARDAGHRQLSQSYTGAITGKLGEWLAVGSTGQRHNESSARRRSTAATDRVIIYLKAERLE
ncbi:hypothetical protein FKG94_17715 [Exilibacterium tricleocarpae]|uniref:NolW-like domain-containing protein n=1 Tax=Exilibacterium tricleocarpae TaxID=2591008 RepID=A0A545T8J3_9GAMM|nr:secretin N-terminal domain-containing protein [Exilibacterium tricleocarpae]TQV73534.1 hypothetical protein FKG94_17715 [Exilibacterium tricleocarpae]